jgi:excisionase family DNA binding protein
MHHLATTEPWLELSEAADFLGVHFTTLRRWADAGQVPCIRTPGGRRRFSKVELSLFLASLHRGEVALPHAARALPPGASSRLMSHPSVSQEPWYGRLDESQRAAFRTQGQGLMAVLMQYATRSNGGDVFLEEGRRVAIRYGEACARAGLSLIETLQTFIHVRRGFMDPIYEAGTLAGTPDADTWRLYDRMNTFLDNMLVAMLDAFYSSQQAQLPA